MKQIEDKVLREIFDKSKEIPGYPDYRITKDGRVFSKRSGNWIESNIYYHCGRPKVSIYGKPKLLYRLLAITFIPNPDNKLYVCHKDNNPKNFDLSNLYWGTQSENMLQCVRDGRYTGSKLTLEQVVEIKNSRLSKQALARLYGVSRRTIYGIIKGEVYAEIQ